MLPQLLLDLFDDLTGAPRRPAPPPPELAPSALSSPITRTRWLADARRTLQLRFSALGHHALGEIRTHANLRTMVSESRGVVRLHAGYAMAPDRVLIAIVRFLDRRTSRALRLEARRVLLEFPVQQSMPPHLLATADVRRRTRAAEPVRPADRRLLGVLRERHAMLNAQYFAGTLSPIPLVVSGRMRRKLGHVALEGGRATELALSRRHLLRDAETAWMETLLHEMVHQWQAETGRPVDHGAEFRRKAVELGITPRAVRPA